MNVCTLTMKHAIKIILPAVPPLFIVGIIFSFLSVQGCSPDEKQSIPTRPGFVTKSEDTAYYDTGVRAVYGNQGIHLEWHPNTEEDLAGYKLYRTTETTILGTGEISPINFSLLKTIPLGSQKTQGLPDTLYEDLSIEFDQSYYYRLSAYSRSGGESVTSDASPNYKLLQLPYGLSATSGGVTSDPLPFPQDSILTFSWIPKGSATGGNFILKIYEFNDFTGDEAIVAWAKTKGGYTSGIPVSLTIDFSSLGTIPLSSANDGRVVNYLKRGDTSYGRQYIWRIYSVEGGSDNLGSIAEGRFNLGD